MPSSVEEPRRVGVVVVAAGSGRRFGDPPGARKQYRDLLGAPLLVWALRPFLRHPAVVRTVAVLPAEDVARPPAWLESLPVLRVSGGSERSDSVRKGLAALGEGCDLVLVHDGARPFVSHALIDRVLDAAGDGNTGAVPGLRITDTLKEVSSDGFITGTADRSHFWRVQTPQAFPIDALRRVHERAHAEGVTATDDAALFERYGIPVRMIEGDPDNLKITTQSDLALAAVVAQRLPPRF